MGIKIDLITGFLGSGKTTFIKKYVEYLLRQGERVGILENDYGPINVDLMVLSDLRGENCEIEMISGGCDYDCHVRRFKTKLISMAMSNYTRVIVEPSGIFDTDEFFDLVFEDPLSNWYEIGSVITVVDANMSILDSDSKYIFSSMLATCGRVIFSKVTNQTKEDLVPGLNNALEEIGCIRKINNDEVLLGNFGNFTDEEFNQIKNSKYHSYSYVKKNIMDNNMFSSLYIMNESLSKETLLGLKDSLFNSFACGEVKRIKGFFTKDSKWYLMNMTKNETNIEEISYGQDVIIIIGKNLDETKIKELLKK